jgi:ribonuclease HII
MTLIAGVDEVGRGPLAGPVFAVAVILDKTKRIKGLNDSKQLTEIKRNQLSALIRSKAVCWAYGSASVKEIDEINILHASMLAMSRAISSLPIRPDKVVVDGNRVPKTDLPCEAVIGGDATVAEISAASIVAKVIRDYLMTVFDKKYPQYGFSKHKGYATKDHMTALKKYGASPIHRRSFAPVRDALASHGEMIV